MAGATQARGFVASPAGRHAMRHALLVVLLCCVSPALGRGHDDDKKLNRHSEPHRRLQLSFEARADYPTGDGGLGLVTGDFNRDGVLDIATLHGGPVTPDVSTVTVLLGTRDGDFTRAPDVFLGTNVGPVGIVAADFDRDGRIDLAILLRSASSITILSGRGDGTFEPTRTIPAVIDNPIAFISADFNGDERPDFAVLNRPFPDPSVPPGIGVPGNITLLIAQKGAAFQPTTVPVGRGASAMVAGDFNRDRRSDLAVVTQNGVTILLGGTFQAWPDFPVPGATLIAAGDIDGDRRLDLALLGGGRPGSVSVLNGFGDGTFQLGQTLSATPQPPLVTPPGFFTAL